MSAVPASAAARGGVVAMLRNRRAAAGFALVGLAVAAALLAPVLTPYAPNEPDFLAVLSGPSLQHPLGTDDLGRDVLTRVFHGARVSLVVGVFSVLSALIAGTVLGAAAVNLSSTAVGS